jgi:light-regulated signal transduction histidine kinase (bacteriophytochrome)
VLLSKRIEDRSVELIKANAELQQFIYAATHDLKEPLRMMTKYLQLLELKCKGNLDKDSEKFIHYMRDGSKRMYELIENMLRYAQIDSDDDELKPTDLSGIVFQIGYAAKKADPGREIEVICDPLPSVPWSFQLKTALQCLIENGLKFNRSPQPQVRVLGEGNADRWLISVVDNGIGVDSKYFSRIFDPLKRLHGIEEFSGTGMGLAICKKIIERHGGQIWFESSVGSGSKVSFTIPMHTAIDQKMHDAI